MGPGDYITHAIERYILNSQAAKQLQQARPMFVHVPRRFSHQDLGFRSDIDYLVDLEYPCAWLR
jgi:hypothetical protein